MPGSLAERIFFCSPIWLQNQFVSAYGFHLYRQRFGGRHPEHLHELEESQWFPRMRLEDLQENLFVQMAKHALETVPFYRTWASEQGFTANDIRGLADLERFPILEKEELRRHPDRLCSDRHLDRRSSFWLSTSGTSGKPLRILCDNDSRRRHYAFWTRFRRWHGISPGTVRATFFGRVAVPPEQCDPPFWRYDAAGRNWLFSSYHLAPKNLPGYAQKLAEIQPEEIIGYPSSLYALAKFLVTSSFEIRPKVVITTAETLQASHRELIEKAFSCPVVDQYGCTEMAIFVSQCEKGKYHLHPEHGILELEEEGDGVGRVICTGLVNKAMPLLRYRLDDRVVMGKGECSCGRAFPIIAEIVGRLDDCLWTPDGRPLGRLDPVFKGLSGIFETQIIQRDPGSIELAIVADAEFSPGQEEDLLAEVRKRVGSAMRIEIRKVSHIPKEANGKFKAVVSMVGK